MLAWRSSQWVGTSDGQEWNEPAPLVCSRSSCDVVTFAGFMNLLFRDNFIETFLSSLLPLQILKSRFRCCLRWTAFCWEACISPGMFFGTGCTLHLFRSTGIGPDGRI